MQNEKKLLIQEIHAMALDPICRSVLKLLTMEIEECRVENDVIGKEELPYNQGKIAAFVGLKNYIEKGVRFP